MPRPRAPTQQARPRLRSKSRVWRACKGETFKFSTDHELEAKVAGVIRLYRVPPEKAVVLCVDEKCRSTHRTGHRKSPAATGHAEQRTAIMCAPPPCSPRWRSLSAGSPASARICNVPCIAANHDKGFDWDFSNHATVSATPASSGTGSISGKSARRTWLSAWECFTSPSLDSP